LGMKSTSQHDTTVGWGGVRAQSAPMRGLRDNQGGEPSVEMIKSHESMVQTCCKEVWKLRGDGGQSQSRRLKHLRCCSDVEHPVTY
jgi:hypothetical protein